MDKLIEIVIQIRLEFFDVIDLVTLRCCNKKLKLVIDQNVYKIFQSKKIAIKSNMIELFEIESFNKFSKSNEIVNSLKEEIKILETQVNKSDDFLHFDINDTESFVKKAAEIIFIPGASFTGTICIPEYDCGESQYKLEIVQKIKNLYGEEFIIARHCAYEDEQYFPISLEIEKDNLIIKYQDSQTSCVGYFDFKGMKISGNVFRIQKTFTIISKNKKKNQFFLELNKHNNKIIQLRNLLIKNESQRSIDAANWVRSQLLLDRLELTKNEMKKYSFTDILISSQRNIEEFCCYSKICISIINKITFENDEEKNKVFENLELMKITQSDMEAKANILLINFKYLFRVRSKNEPFQLGRYRACFRKVGDCLKTTQFNFNLLTSRATKQQIIEYQKSDRSNLCSICITNFSVDDIVLMTWCHHFFHQDCLTTWLKNKNVCPFCRSTLTTTKKIK